ncbi:hypothetical protein A3A09_00080 [Candidatus Nomurabacteria bacterium RIFCSPLOWO2_01_FULL_42_20]|uniref:Uncharacterized protein n=1 Tax=Candidatus Nomurabacteria bacterium RIFCSPHIGHO2_01_FULL_42_16 TaxID=1801743 RepID=A0A1F6VIJ8_9BACT|nr:MAG: hypothetical protein A2824_03430 [Candidatus Nomurabacteria bacterium RIFCSPHIGHO2_01_FULL_42_16]OGI91198.1 MAG: hypothetical protein A3A09_00080 [Candidatus Nomurabacteria bacterium RIFCSPLOWO2_01_FULL_42_20]
MSNEGEKTPRTPTAGPGSIVKYEKESKESKDLDLSNFLFHYHELEKIVKSVGGDSKWLMEEKYDSATKKITTEHKDILDALGLELNTVAPSKEAMRESDKQKLNYPEIRIDINDRNKFLHYLKELHPSFLSPPQEDFLITAITSLYKQARDEYDPRNPDGRFLEFFRSLGDIIERYKHFYLPKDPSTSTGDNTEIESKIIPELEDYLHAYKSGSLKELLLAERAGLPLEFELLNKRDRVNSFLGMIYDKEKKQLDYEFLDEWVMLLKEMGKNKNAESLYSGLLFNILGLLDVLISDAPSEEVLREIDDYKKRFKNIA